MLDPVAAVSKQKEAETSDDAASRQVTTYGPPVIWTVAGQIYVNDQELATRLAAAMRRMSELCGGKVEPF